VNVNTSVPCELQYDLYLEAVEHRDCASYENSGMRQMLRKPAFRTVTN
jgi:hypothetical protein